MNIPQAIASTNDVDAAQPSWVDDLHDLTMDELREMPNHLQLGMDLSVLD